MARMSIDDMVARDPRITELAQILGWNRRETVGCLVLDVWPICYDQATHLVSERMIDSAAKHPGFAKAMLECELARRDRSGKLRVSGAQERVKYIKDKAEAGREGGLKSGISRRKSTKQNAKQPEAGGNPPDPVNPIVPDSAPDPANPNTHTQSARACASGLVSEDSENSESQSVAAILAALSTRSGTEYSGSTAHAALIKARLREGITEEDLLKVVAYCAIEKGWESRSEMRPSLRPETLFHHERIHRYLDPARSWFAALPSAKSGAA